MLTVSEAAEVLGVSVHRVRGLVRSGRLGSSQVGSRRYVSTTAIADYQKQRRDHEASLRAAAPLDWDWEGNLVARLAQWFKERGWHEVSRTDAAIREHGVDLVLQKRGRTRVIEVKGWPTATHATGSKAGKPKQWRATIGRNYFGDLVLSAMILRSSRPDDEVAIAVPRRETFMNLLDRIRPSLELLGIGAYVIGEDGSVVEYLAIEDVDHGRQARDHAIDRVFVRRLLQLSDAERERHYIEWNRGALGLIADARRGR
jgi:excisionase family DNA binding protein